MKEINRVYVAGPLTPRGMRDDAKNPAIEYLYNVRDMLRLGGQLIENGYAPFVPGMDFPMFFVNELTEEQIKGIGLSWLEVCDAVVVLPFFENSHGVIAELQRAEELGIPVFGDVHQLNEYVKEMHHNESERIKREGGAATEERPESASAERQ